MKNYSVLVSGPGKNWDDWIQNLSSFEGFTGLLETPDPSQMTFLPDEQFEVLEFGSEAAKKCLEWMENDFSQSNADRYARIYFSRPAAELGGLAKELHVLNPLLKVISLQEEIDRDYQEEFRKNFKGNLAGKNFWLGPTWQKPPAGRIPIYVVPGMSFGTGEHPTTQLCVGLLENLAAENVRPQVILDLGTGTGVLAIVARQLFPQSKIWASDLDPQCEEDFACSLVMNDRKAQEFQTYFGPGGDLNSLKRNLPKIDLLISNIYAEVLVGLLDPIQSLLNPGATWIVSGILDGEICQNFEKAVLARNFKIVDRQSQIRPRAQFEKDRGLVQENERWVAYRFSTT